MPYRKPKPSASRHRFTRWVAISAMTLVGAAAISILATSWWIDFSEEPVKSDIIVALNGGFLRQVYAADLYKQGYARQIWISQPASLYEHEFIRNLGIAYPREEAVDREILIKRGVPSSNIRFYGKDVGSTVDEADAIRKEFDSKGKKILIVTSRYHARRSLLIFRRYLPQAEIRVAATPYEAFDRRWWRHKYLSYEALVEMFKLLYYISGIRFAK